MKYMRPIGKIILVLAIAIFFCGCSLNQSKPMPVALAQDVGMSQEKLDLIDPAIQKFVDDNKIAGASVIVARCGTIVYEKNFGLMDIETKKGSQK